VRATRWRRLIDTHVGATVTQLVHARLCGSTYFFHFVEVEPRPVESKLRALPSRGSSSAALIRPSCAVGRIDAISSFCVHLKSASSRVTRCVDSSDTHVGATVTQPESGPSRIKASSACQDARFRAPHWLSRASARSDEVSLESVTNARHSGNHRRRGVSRHASLAQRFRVAPNPSRGLTRSSVFSAHLRSTPREPRDGVDSSIPTWARWWLSVHARLFGNTYFSTSSKSSPARVRAQPDQSVRCPHAVTSHAMASTHLIPTWARR
jgi:hypothetical protein